MICKEPRASAANKNLPTDGLSEWSAVYKYNNRLAELPHEVITRIDVNFLSTLHKFKTISFSSCYPHCKQTLAECWMDDIQL